MTDPRAYLMECKELLEHSFAADHPKAQTAILRIIDVLDLEIQRMDSLEARVKRLESTSVVFDLNPPTFMHRL